MTTPSSFSGGLAAGLFFARDFLSLAVLDFSGLRLPADFAFFFLSFFAGLDTVRFLRGDFLRPGLARAKTAYFLRRREKRRPVRGFFALPRNRFKIFLTNRQKTIIHGLPTFSG